MLYKVYILYSLGMPKTYVGYTENLEGRLKYHNSGKVAATKHYQPWKIIYTENNLSRTEAKNRERYWKSGAGRRNIRKILNGFPPNFRKVRPASLSRRRGERGSLK